jgi:hypothetical protein
MITLHLAEEDNEFVYINEQKIDLILAIEDSEGSEIIMQNVGVQVKETPEEVVRIINGRFN